jgi:hypothetical protein
MFVFSGCPGESTVQTKSILVTMEITGVIEILLTRDISNFVALDRHFCDMKGTSATIGFTKNAVGMRQKGYRIMLVDSEFLANWMERQRMGCLWVKQVLCQRWSTQKMKQMKSLEFMRHPSVTGHIST